MGNQIVKLCYCGNFIFADTEDWKNPVCYNHYLDHVESLSELTENLEQKPCGTIEILDTDTRKIENNMHKKQLKRVHNKENK